MKFYTHNSSRQLRTSGVFGVLSLVTLVHERGRGGWTAVHPGDGTGIQW